MTAKAVDRDGKLLPTAYAELVKLWPPRTIRSDEELHKALAVVHQLAGFDLTADQDDYLDLVSDLVAAYEAQRFPHLNRTLSHVEILRLVMETMNMTASDLGRLLGDRSVVSAIVTGRRQLSKNHIRILCEEFKLDPMAFLQAVPSRPSKRSGKPAGKLRGTPKSTRALLR